MVFRQPPVALQLALPVHPLAQDDVVKYLRVPCMGDIVTLGACLQLYRIQLIASTTPATSSYSAAPVVSMAAHVGVLLVRGQTALSTNVALCTQLHSSPAFRDWARHAELAAHLQQEGWGQCFEWTVGCSAAGARACLGTTVVPYVSTH